MTACGAASSVRLMETQQLARGGICPSPLQECLVHLRPAQMVRVVAQGFHADSQDDLKDLPVRVAGCMEQIQLVLAKPPASMN